MSLRCVIIGAGPAGTVAGALLARAGAKVTILEAQAFPRDKVCGECLSALGWDVLTRLGMQERLVEAGAVQLRRTILHDGSGRHVEMPLPRACWGISRRVMDSLLLACAAEAGVRVLQPARCERIDGGPETGVAVRELAANRVTTLRAEYVLLADGKSSMVEGRPAPTADLGVKAHFSDVDGPRDAVELFTLDGHYVGLNPVEGGRWNLAMSVPAARVRDLRGDLEALYAQMLLENAGLRRRLARARRLDDWLASPLPRFGVQTKRWPANVIPIGNAAAAIEPIGGEGMGLAMRSAELAAEAIASVADDQRCAGSRLDFESVAPAFTRLWRRRRVTCRAAALLLSRTSLAPLAVAALHRCPALQRATLALIGK